MNTLERIFAEEKREGMAQGKCEGEILGLKKSVHRLLLHGYTPDQVVDLLNISVDSVREVEGGNMEGAGMFQK